MPCMTEEELALWHRAQGHNVVLRRGRWWHESIRGFYQPVNFAAPLRAEEAAAPALSWGWRAVLADAASANGALPMHVCEDLAGFGVERLNTMQRRNVEKCRKQVALVAADARLLREQGHEVVVSSLGRTGHQGAPSKERYLSELDAYAAPGRLLILAGLVGGRLAGYITGFAADGVAYVHVVYSTSESMRTGIGSGLLFEFIQCCRRSGKIHTLVHGLDTPEKPTLRDFKAAFGLPVVRAPTLVRMNPLAGAWIRRRWPEKHYRLTGLPS